jgi:hypothetical protein
MRLPAQGGSCAGLISTEKRRGDCCWHRPFFPFKKFVEAKKRLSFGSLNPKPQLPLHTSSNALSLAFCTHNRKPLLQFCCSQETVYKCFLSAENSHRMERSGSKQKIEPLYILGDES